MPWLLLYPPALNVLWATHPRRWLEGDFVWSVHRRVGDVDDHDLD